MTEGNTAGEARGIQAIDKGSVHRICSGQVVLNLATAIKELVENSIDAGATNVEVRLKEHGSELLEVIDNGSGVEEKNFSGLTLKHHTSKLKDFSDLVNVDTFGFRGEALSSLCALSKLTITTCHRDVSVGSKIEYNYNGKLVKQSPCPRQNGTTVSLENLFSTLPVRHREFLRNIKREFTKAIQVLNAYCIISTGVRITCTNQVGKGKKNLVVSTAGNQTVKENITNVFGAKQGQTLLAFHQVQPGAEVCDEYSISDNQKEKSLFEITGYLSSSEHGQGRSSSDRQFYFINKRPCDPQKVSRLVNEVYHMYNRHQNPFVMMDISLAKESVDVNVTPDKRQIFIQEEKLLLATIKSSLMTLFEPKSSVYRVNDIASKNSQMFKSFSRTSPLKRQNSLKEESPKKSLTSSFANLKRNFSSAFAQKPSEAEDENRSKQRKLDCFMVTPASDFETKDSQSISLSEKLTNEQGLEAPFEDTQTDSLIGSRTESQTSGFSSADTDTLVDSEEPPVETLLHSTDLAQSPNKKYPKETTNFNTSKSLLTVSCDELALHNSHHDVHGDIMTLHTDTVSEVTDITVEKVAALKKGEQITESESESNAATVAQMDSCDEIKSCITNNISQRTDDNCENEIITNTQFDEGSSSRHVRELKVPFCMDRLRRNLQNRSKGLQPTGRQSRNFRAQINPSDNTAAEEELQKEISKDMFKEMKILGQFNLGFIITKLGRDLFIVDQHATDEKFNFETLQRETVIQGQKLIQPQNLELTAANECILMDNLEVFRKNGFDFHVDEAGQPTQRVLLTTMPVSKNWTFGKDDIEELIFMLSDSPGVMCRPSRIRQMFASRACRKSIMIGTALNKSEMKKLVCHMGEIDQPWNCPHGRPTMRHLINLDMLPD